MPSFDDRSAAPGEPANRLDDDAAACVPESGRRPVGRANGPRMIIVEDAPLIALDLAETMRDLGFDVWATASTHDQALARSSTPSRTMP